MLKVVHIVSSFSLGGVQTGILYSMKELNTQFEYKVIAYTADDNWLKDIAEDIRKNIIVLGSSNLISGSLKATRLLQKMKPDVVVASLWKSVPAAAAYKLINPKVCLCGFYHQNGIIHFPEHFFLWLLAKKQDISFADSNATKVFIEKKLGIKNAAIVPYLFEFNNPAKTPGIDSSTIKLVFLGRLTGVKRIDRILLFCKLCKDAGIHFLLDIYGKGDIEKCNTIILNYKLQNEVTIKNLLPLNKIQSTMMDYDFLIQLSDIEGMALSVVEALSCGLVPIVTPVGEIEHYTKDGINAIWLDKDFDENLPLLVKKLSALFNNPNEYKLLSENAVATFKNQPKYVESFIAGINNFTTIKMSR